MNQLIAFAFFYEVYKAIIKWVIVALLVGFIGFCIFRSTIADEYYETKKRINPELRITIKGGKADTTYLYKKSDFNK